MYWGGDTLSRLTDASSALYRAVHARCLVVMCGFDPAGITCQDGSGRE